MIMVEHDQIERLLGDVSFATMQRGTKERIDHLDERRGPDNRVELVEHQRFEGVKGLVKESVGTRQPEVSFSLMRALLLRPRLRAYMILVPGQHEEIQGLVWYHHTECSSDGFGLFEGEQNVIDMMANGLERLCDRRAIELGDHVEKPREFRTHAFRGAQCAMRRADV